MSTEGAAFSEGRKDRRVLVTWPDYDVEGGGTGAALAAAGLSVRLTIGFAKALRAISRGDHDAEPSFREGLAVSRVAAAAASSSESGEWISLK